MNRGNIIKRKGSPQIEEEKKEDYFYRIFFHKDQSITGQIKRKSIFVNSNFEGTVTIIIVQQVKLPGLLSI